MLNYAENNCALHKSFATLIQQETHKIENSRALWQAAGINVSGPLGLVEFCKWPKAT
jgi:hypothetical protein